MGRNERKFRMGENRARHAKSGGSGGYQVQTAVCLKAERNKMTRTPKCILLKYQVLGPKKTRAQFLRGERGKNKYLVTFNVNTGRPTGNLAWK